MSRKPESQFINSVHNHLPPPTQLHREKMHNMYRSGTFDCWYSGSLDDLWGEFKYEPSFPIQDRFILPKLSPNQIRWGAERYKEGRNLVVIVGYPQGGVIYYSPDEWEVKGLDITQLTDRLMSRKELANYICFRTTGKYL
jgi:hypothetical protein